MDKTPPNDASQEQNPTGAEADGIFRQWYPPPSEPSDNSHPPTGIHDLQPATNYQDVSHGGGGNINSVCLPETMVWMPMMGPDCSGTCPVLRDVIHGRDTSTYKLSLHGTWGLIYHAVLTVRQTQNHILSESRFIIDLRSYDFGTIKSFLEVYGRGRHLEGFRVLLDTVPPIYRELAVPLNPGSGGNNHERGGEAGETGRRYEAGQSSISSKAPAKPKNPKRR